MRDKVEQKCIERMKRKGERVTKRERERARQKGQKLGSIIA